MGSDVVLWKSLFGGGLLVKIIINLDLFLLVIIIWIL